MIRLNVACAITIVVSLSSCSHAPNFFQCSLGFRGSSLQNSFTIQVAPGDHAYLEQFVSDAADDLTLSFGSRYHDPEPGFIDHLRLILQVCGGSTNINIMNSFDPETFYFYVSKFHNSDDDDFQRVSAAFQRKLLREFQR